MASEPLSFLAFIANVFIWWFAVRAIAGDWFGMLHWVPVSIACFGVPLLIADATSRQPQLLSCLVGGWYGIGLCLAMVYLYRSLTGRPKSDAFLPGMSGWQKSLSRPGLTRGGEQMVKGAAWSDQTLTQLEDDDWGEPDYPSYIVTDSHRLRHKPLREFTAEDLRFMLGQQISLPILMPMALDVLELEDPFAGGKMYPGALLCMALNVNPQFWRDNPRLWHRMNVVLVEVYAMQELLEQELLPAAATFETLRPQDEREC